MHRFFVPALAIAILALTTSPVMAQGNSSKQATAPSPTTTQLTLEFDALNSMTDSMGPMVTEAESRIKLMNAFIASKGLTDKAAAAPAAEGSNAFHGLSFQQAYQVALKNQKMRGDADAPMSDTDMLQKEVAATQTMVHDQWNRVNKMHTQVANLTSFLQSQNMMDEYMKWSDSDAAAQVLKPKPITAATPRESSSGGISPEQRAQNIKNYQAQQELLRNHWANYHFTYSTAPARDPLYNNTTGHAYIAGSGDYYNGNYWNGYGDPYYDVWGGYPENYGADRWRDAYRRGTNPRPAVSPGHGHPSIRR